MLIEELKSIKSSKKDLRNFGLVVGVVLLALGGFLLWRRRPAYPYFLGGGALLAVAGLLFPAVLKPLQKVWMAMAVVIGWVMTRVILSLLFFLVLTPIGLVSRVFGKRFLDLRPDRAKHSYWKYRSAEKHDPRKYERQF